MGGLHGQGVVQPLQHPHLPAEGLQLGAPLDDRAGEVHADPAPTLVVGDLVRRAYEAQARAPDPRLGGEVVEPRKAW